MKETTRSGSRAPRRSDRFARAAGGQSETFAVVLLVVVVLAGTVVAVTGASSVLGESQRQAQLEGTERSLAAFDARSARVALGKSDAQTVRLGDAGDGYRIDDDAGWLRITHYDYDADGSSDETVYNGTLGALVYENGRTTFAYQGGGVWRREANGSVMVSPPEVHYRGETLTLPVVQVRGSGAVAGDARASVRRVAPARPVYPNRSESDTDLVGAPYGQEGPQYRNPVQNGTVEVTVRSAYYAAWADYFRSRTGGTVTVDEGNRTVTLELTAGGTLGDFGMPNEGNAVEVRGMPDEHSLTNFTVVLLPDEKDAASFDNLQWTLWTEEGNREFEIHLRLNGEDDDPSTACTEQEISMTVYYSETNGNSYHGWQNSTAFRTECYASEGPGERNRTRLVANLTGPTPLEVTDLSASDLEYYNTQGATRVENVTFDEHAAEVSWEPATFNATGDDDTTARRALRHYAALLGPNFDVVVDDKDSDTVNEDGSWGTIQYEAEGQVTFLHVTENRLRVRLEA